MTSAIPFLMASVWLCPGQIPAIESPDFAKDKQMTTVLATVRIQNLSKNLEGSGVFIGKSAAFAYIFTSQHLIDGADRLEVAVFTKDSYPRPYKTYRSAEKAAEGRGLADLGLLRLAIREFEPSILRVCPEGKIPKAMPLALLTAGCDTGTAPDAEAGKERRSKDGPPAGCKRTDHFLGSAGQISVRAIGRPSCR